MEGSAAPIVTTRVLLLGWGAAAAEVMREALVRPKLDVLCISHSSQAADCDLPSVCNLLGFTCKLTDDDDELFEAARAFQPQLIISASYRKRLRADVLGLCGDALNFHPSLLPLHRGCWSGFWVIFDGDRETGVTCHRMVERFDEGLVLHQERLPVLPEDTSESLYRRLLPVTANCARTVVDLFLSPGGLPPGRAQQGLGSYHYRRLPFGGLVQIEWPDVQVERFIRAMHFPPFDGAAIDVANGEGKRRKVLVESVAEVRRLREDAAAVEQHAPESGGGTLGANA